MRTNRVFFLERSKTAVLQKKSVVWTVLNIVLKPSYWQMPIWQSTLAPVMRAEKYLAFVSLTVIDVHKHPSIG